MTHIGKKKQGIEFHGAVLGDKSPVYQVKYRYGKRSLRNLPVFSYRCSHAMSFAWGDADIARCLQLSYAILYAYHVKVLGMTDSVETAENITMDIYHAFYRRCVRRLPASAWTLNERYIERFLSSHTSDTSNSEPSATSNVVSNSFLEKEI